MLQTKLVLVVSGEVVGVALSWGREKLTDVFISYMLCSCGLDHWEVVGKYQQPVGGLGSQHFQLKYISV